MVQQQGGFPTLDLTVLTVGINNVTTIPVPDNVAKATPQPLKVDAQKVAEGVWYVTGGTHHSAAVEFNDHLVVIEAPLTEERSLAVIDEMKRLVPTKPIRYLVNTHQHFDHLGGVRTYAAEGATIITQQMFKPYYEKLFTAPRTLNPDRLAQSKRKLVVEEVAERRVLTDGTRTVELHRIQGNGHNDGMLIATSQKRSCWLKPTCSTRRPPAGGRGGRGAAPPAPGMVSPYAMNLLENLQRLKLDVAQIAALHGRLRRSPISSRPADEARQRLAAAAAPNPTNRQDSRAEPRRLEAPPRLTAPQRAQAVATAGASAPSRLSRPASRLSFLFQIFGRALLCLKISVFDQSSSKSRITWAAI